MTIVFDYGPGYGPPQPGSNPDGDTFSYIKFTDSGSDAAQVKATVGDSQPKSTASGNFVIGAPKGLHFVAGTGGSATIDFHNVHGTPASLAIDSGGGANLSVIGLNFVRNPLAELFQGYKPDWSDSYSPCRLMSSASNLAINVADSEEGAHDASLQVCAQHGVGVAVTEGGAITLNPWPAKFADPPMAIAANADVQLRGTVYAPMIILDQHQSWNPPGLKFPSTGVKLRIFSGSLPSTVGAAPQGSAVFYVNGGTVRLYIQTVTGSSGTATVWKYLALSAV